MVLLLQYCGITISWWSEQVPPKYHFVTSYFLNHYVEHSEESSFLLTITGILTYLPITESAMPVDLCPLTLI